MNKKILVDLGENFEYARTIIENKVELAKLSLVEILSKIVSKFILYIVIGFFSAILFIGGLVALAIWVNQVFDSIFLGIGLAGVFVLIITFIVFTFRKAIIITPVTNAIFDSLDPD